MVESTRDIVAHAAAQVFRHARAAPARLASVQYASSRNLAGGQALGERGAQCAGLAGGVIERGGLGGSP